MLGSSRSLGNHNRPVVMSNNFRVKIDDDKYNLGTWVKVTGLTVSWQPCEYRVGDRTDKWVCPGQEKYQNVTLSRAACEDSRIVQRWLQDTSRDHKPLSGSVTMIDPTGRSIVEWKLKRCFPLSWKIVDFDSGGPKPAMETLELTHTGFLNETRAR